MALIDEATRRKVHASLVAVHGEEVGDGIMAHLPPVGWADVATKHDLAHAVEVLEIRIEASEARMQSALHREITKQTRLYIFSTLTAIAAVAGMAFGGLGG